VRDGGGGLDALVNNAGIGASGARRELSADGFELRFAVNYLAGLSADAFASARSRQARIAANRQRRLGGTAANFPT
jgi:NAD(P)-dependent dehydrogenase (short-subunit alcohol dehydrogenase family)